MICQISEKILKFTSEHLDISPEMKDVYQYGIEITISSMLNVTLVLLCSLILGNVLAGLLYLFIFIFLRSFTGGYHATTYFRCNLTIVLTFIITFFAYYVISGCQFSIYICGTLTAVSFIPIVLFSPVPNKHKQLGDKQRKNSYILSIIIASALSVIGLALMALGISFGAMIITTVAMISVLIIVEIFMKRRGYHES